MPDERLRDLHVREPEFGQTPSERVVPTVLHPEHAAIELMMRDAHHVAALLELQQVPYLAHRVAGGDVSVVERLADQQRFRERVP